MIRSILKKAVSSEFDYNLLLSCLSMSKNPRKQITKLIKNKDIIRVKKGLYVFGPGLSDLPYSLEVLANLIYGPSYISCEYALSYYGLIPEKVNIVTCITNKRNKYFKTPVGEFLYKYLASEKYSIGITQIKINKNRNILIASKEKALLDILDREKGTMTAFDIRIYLLENLRIQEEELEKININEIIKYNKKFNSKKIETFISYLKGLK